MSLYCAPNKFTIKGLKIFDLIEKVDLYQKYADLLIKELN
tara:strand:+ start:425 stop:544 length:120 start_codon:yes stop_codon:yes gene_type:complete